MADISNVAENIYMIDNRLFSIPKWGSVYLLDETEKAIVESGPTTSVDAVLEGLAQLGREPEDISYLIVTHIHLDHAGGAGSLMKLLPNARLVVHHRGARHMVDPSRLVAGAVSARGKDVSEMHGEVIPVDNDRLLPVSEGDFLTLSHSQILTFLDTPGHAPHELCIHETRNDGVFTGDALALYIPDYDIVLPYHPPPQFNLKMCLETLDRLEYLSPDKIYYSHFGVSDNTRENIARARKMLLEWDDIVREAIKNDVLTEVKTKLIDRAVLEINPIKNIPDMAPLYSYLIERSFPTSTEGHIAYYKELYK
ncbi:MAG: MBL fold metallo-hydrolase [Dehalococcoidales bacterium]|nr:MAG: MBL fold metallo-hydrolase [Dehalococcoidales bacterium]